MGEIQTLLTTLMRTIDKRTSLSVEQSKDQNRSAVTVHLQRDRRKGTVELADADILAAKSDAMRRNAVRTTLKRAHDRMWDTENYIFSTKMEAHRQDEGFFRPRTGGQSRGGRR